MAERVRIQIKDVSDPERWEDVDKTTGLPVSVISKKELYTNNTDSSVSDTIYVGKDRGDGTWMVEKIVNSSSGIAKTYATQRNNSTITTFVDAWDARSTLTYGQASGVLVDF